MQRLVWLWTVSLFIKLGLSGFLPLSPDEAYYWFWTKHLQLSYFDHPPFVAWLLTLGRGLESFHSFVRAPAVIFLHLSFWVWYPLLRRFLNRDQIWDWALLWLLNPLTGVGSIIVTPDLAILFFWPLACLTLLMTFETKSLSWAAGFGISLGFGFCAKYHMALFGFIALTWVIWERRFTFKHFPALAISMLFFVASSLPVWWWNWENDFISFRFQIDHGLGSSQWKPFWTWSYLLGQALLIFPLVLWAATKNSRSRSVPFWVKFLAFGPLLFFLLSSFRGKVEANWPIVAYPFIFALAAIRFPKVAMRSVLTLWFAALLFLVVDGGFDFVPDQLSPSKIKEIRLIEFASRATQSYRPLYTTSYQLAAKMSFETKEDIYKLKGSGRVDFFDSLKKSLPEEGSFYFLTWRGDHLPELYRQNHIVEERIPIGDKLDLLKVVDL